VQHSIHRRNARCPTCSIVQHKKRPEPTGVKRQGRSDHPLNNKQPVTQAAIGSSYSWRCLAWLLLA